MLTPSIRHELTDWRDVSLLGIDVGFSERRKTTGIAFYHFGQGVSLHCVGSLAAHRAEILTCGQTFDAIAIDGPIVAETSSPSARHCERVLSRGRFATRCKAGFSHFGTGLQLRHAATMIASEMPKHQRAADAPIVESFPNAFLGVMLGDDDYAVLGKIARGKKSDVFYRRVADNRMFEKLLDHLRWTDDGLLKTLHDNATAPTRAAHEHRAALVCILTAGCALSGQAEYVGDDAGGFICLPPLALWAPWARDAMPPQP